VGLTKRSHAYSIMDPLVIDPGNIDGHLSRAYARNPRDILSK
jgi:hypothetical protein